MQQNPEVPEQSGPAKGLPPVDLNGILGQLEDLVKLTIENETKEIAPNVSFSEVHERLMKIQKNIETFQQSYRQVLEMAGVKEADLKPTPEEIESLNPEAKRLYQRLEKLQKTCEIEREKMYVSLQRDRAMAKKVKEDLQSDTSARAHRKGKFKSLGGKQNWLPT